jgi:hypothetical protein
MLAPGSSPKRVGDDLITGRRKRSKIEVAAMYGIITDRPNAAQRRPVAENSVILRSGKDIIWKKSESVNLHVISDYEKSFTLNLHL